MEYKCEIPERLEKKIALVAKDGTKIEADAHQIYKQCHRREWMNAVRRHLTKGSMPLDLMFQEDVQEWGVETAAPTIGKLDAEFMMAKASLIYEPEKTDELLQQLLSKEQQCEQGGAGQPATTSVSKSNGGNPPKIEILAAVADKNPMDGINLTFAEWEECDQFIISNGIEMKIKSLISETRIKAGKRIPGFKGFASYWTDADNKLCWFGNAYPFYVVRKSEIVAFQSVIMGSALRIETQSRLANPSVDQATTARLLAKKATEDSSKFVGNRIIIDLRKVVDKNFLDTLDRSSFQSATIDSIKMIDDTIVLNLTNVHGGHGVLTLGSDNHNQASFKRN